MTALSPDTGSSSSDFIVNTASQTVSGTLSAALGVGETVQVSTDGTTWVNATTIGTAWSVALTLPAGSGALSVRTIDTSSNIAAGTGHAFTLDTTAPTALATVTALGADTGSSGSDFITNTAAQTVTGTLSATLGAGETVQVSTDGTTWINATTTGTTWSVALTLPSSSGAVSTRTIDIAGNVAAGTGHAFTLNTTAPTVLATVTALSIDTGGSGSDFITSTASQTITGTLSAALAACRT